jgi:hypothetical protein
MNTATTITTANLANMLAAPFAADEIKWKPQCVKGNRALAIAYLDARLVEDRLDAVFGPGGWQDSYSVLASGDVVCTLRVRIDGEWIEKSDVGGQSEQQDEGDRMKAAFSDALKRASVKLGVGRYLYRLGGQWVDYDEKARQFKRTPTLPAWVMPNANGSHQPRSNENGANSGVAKITQDQWDKVKEALARSGVPARVLLNHFKIVKPSELPAGKFAEALQLATMPTQAWAGTKAAVA